MTNYEWIKNNDELLKKFLVENLSVVNNELKICHDVFWSGKCKQCKFKHSEKSCHDVTKEWLEAEHGPLYKKGDVIIVGGRLYYVVSDNSEKLYVTDKKSYVRDTLGCGIVDYSCVEQKVGNIYD